eukprot:5129461-Amphidinium_carterae.2
MTNLLCTRASTYSSCGQNHLRKALVAKKTLSQKQSKHHFTSCEAEALLTVDDVQHVMKHVID